MESNEQPKLRHIEILSYAIGGDDMQKTHALNALIDEMRKPARPLNQDNMRSTVGMEDATFLKALMESDTDINHYARLQASLDTLDPARNPDIRIPGEISEMRKTLESLLYDHPARVKEVWNLEKRSLTLRGKFVFVLSCDGEGI